MLFCMQQTEATVLNYVNMEGYLEKLPINKKKATLLKTWKRRYFRARDGYLYYYDVSKQISKINKCHFKFNA